MADYTLEQVEALRSAIAKGIRRVEYLDKAVTYASLDEMLRVLRVMEESLGLKKKGARLLAETSKGLC